MRRTMIKSIFFSISMMAFLLLGPLFLPCETLAGPAEEIQAEQAAKNMENASQKGYAKTKYAVADTNIHKWPNEESEVLDIALINTSFEVLAEQDGWSMITTASGLAFIKSEALLEKPAPIYQYTEEDLYIMAHVLSGECQNCSDEEQLYVGSVVLNRVAHPKFPNTIKGVVFQKGQYACTRDGNYYREPTERNWANARKLLENGSVLPGNVIWQSGGRQGKGVYLKTRWHYYCY